MRVLIVSASMGAGHDGAAKELARRLERDGHRTTTRDFLDAIPARSGPLVRASYEWELKLAPWAYELTYRLCVLMPFVTGPIVAFIALFTGRRLRHWVVEAEPDIVVSTYPLASLVFGRMRRRGRLPVPVVTFVTDFAVHPMWTHRGVDLHLAVHPQAAEAAAARTRGRAAAPGPLVPDRFTSTRPDRMSARARLGLADDSQVVLLVAGSWGIGDVERTFDEVVRAGPYLPLVVCGNNEHLRQRLAAKDTGVVVGWTDDMPALMAASDVLVENAGGLTCMEAFACGLPVVTYRPIAGHGRGNARDMARAGVASYVVRADALADALAGAVGAEGAARAAAGRAMFSGDAAVEVVAEAEAARARQPVVSLARHRARVGSLRPRLGEGIAAAVAAVALLYSLAIFGVGTAAAHGLAVVRPPHHAVAAYVGIRLNEGELADPAVRQALEANRVTAIVSGIMAEGDPGQVGGLSAAGVDVANGGWGSHGGFRWTRAHSDLVKSAHAIEAATNLRPRLFVPARPVDGFDLASARATKERIVVASDTDTTGIPALKPGGIYIIDGRQDKPADILALMRLLGPAATAADVDIMPLTTLA